jgi:hypothetical protein
MLRILTFQLTYFHKAAADWKDSGWCGVAFCSVTGDKTFQSAYPFADCEDSSANCWQYGYTEFQWIFHFIMCYEYTGC